MNPSPLPGLVVPGIRIEDPFPKLVRPLVDTKGVATILLPPGHGISRATETLLCDGNLESPCRVELPSDFKDSASLFSELNDGWCFGGRSTNLETFVFGRTDHFHYPRHAVVTFREPPESDALTRARADLTMLYESTKNLPGPLRFCLLHPLQRWSKLTCECADTVWPSFSCIPTMLEFGKGIRRAVEDGYSTYLGLRIYWEAAGRPDRFERLLVASRDAEEWVDDHGIDDRLDELLDRAETAEDGEVKELTDVFLDAFRKGEREAPIKSGAASSRHVSYQHLEAAGIAWRPSGTALARITVRAANALCRNDAFRSCCGIEAGGCRRFIAACRENALLATWASSLASQAESLLYQFCLKDKGLDAAIGFVPYLHTKLAERRDRSRDELIAYSTPDHFVAHATFGELIQVFDRLDGRLHCTIPTDRLERARRVRNLAAHGHAVRWPFIKELLETIDVLLAAS